MPWMMEKMNFVWRTTSSMTGTMRTRSDFLEDYDIKQYDYVWNESYNVQVTWQDDLIVLNSGADESLVPYEVGNRGTACAGKRNLEDAQGNRVQSYGKRLGDIELENDSQTVIIQDKFTVVSVQNPLVSLGRLSKRVGVSPQWKMQKQE